MTNTPKTSSTNSNKDTAPIHQEPQPSRIWEVLSWLGVLSLIAYLVLAISETLNWQLSGDSPIMHYIAWLISQGQVPYRDIFDMNMPGTYLIHLGVISLLGNSSEMWRFFDVGWLALTCVIIIVYCKRQGMLAGVVAATIFACLHISSGEIMMGQRDFLLAPFLILGGHFVANVTENKYRLLAALLAGIIFGCAFWIKPHIALLFFVLFLYAKIQSNSIFVSLLMALGFLLPAGGVMAYLYLNQALLPWWEIVSQYLVPIYIFVGMNVSSQEMIFLMVSSLAIFLPFLALSTPLTGRFFVSLIGVIYGVAHFILQKKGFYYHLSPLFLWASIFVCYRIGSNIKAPKIAPRFAASVGILTACILASPIYLLDPAKFSTTSKTLAKTMENNRDISKDIYADLKDIIKPGDKVQALDHNSGAVHAMLKAKAISATPFLRDFHFYTGTQNYYTQRLEDDFIRRISNEKPRVIILTDDSWPDKSRGFDRIKDSPALVNLLEENYSIEKENLRHRIYIKK